jgi:hypothetical protein
MRCSKWQQHPKSHLGSHKLFFPYRQPNVSSESSRSFSLWVLSAFISVMSRDSSVGIATGYGLDDRGSISGKGRGFSLFNSVHTGSGAHTASYPMGTGGSLPWVKRPRRESDHSSSSNSEVNNGKLYLHSPYFFVA